MPDYTDSVTRKSIDSDILRLYPNAIVNIYDTGTSSPLRATATADANGYWSIPTLIDGHYDIKVDGIIVRTIHHVRFGHDHDASYSLLGHTHSLEPNLESWVFFKAGSVSGDINPTNFVFPSFVASAAGTIIQVKVVIDFIDTSGDITVHLLKGLDDGSVFLTFASDSVWSQNFNVSGSSKYRHRYIDPSPGISMVTDDVLQAAIDFVAASAISVTIQVLFRLDA